MSSTREFFKRYATLSQAGNAKALAELYSRNFVTVGPGGSTAFTNDKKFLKWLEEVHEFNKKSGLEKMIVRKVTSRAMGKSGRQATVTWGAGYKKAKSIIEFDIHYILEKFDSDWKIVLFLSEQDQEALMKENGVL